MILAIELQQSDALTELCADIAIALAENRRSYIILRSYDQRHWGSHPFEQINWRQRLDLSLESRKLRPPQHVLAPGVDARG